MDELYASRVDAVEQVWASWARLGASLTEREWSAPTRCPSWDVAAVYAHVSVFPTAAVAVSNDPSHRRAGGEPVTAVELLARFNAPGGVAHTMAEPVAEAASAEAAAHDRPQLVDRFASAGPRAVAALRDLDATALVPWPASESGIPLTEGLRIMLLEATVHLLDVQRALDQSPDVPASALRETVQLLAELTPAVEFIEAATGRTTRYPAPVLR
jgi:uncharacterized protein (TIGR03083 family)